MAHKAEWKLPPYENTPEWLELRRKWRKDYNTCAECGSTKLELHDHSAIWHDGDLFCENGHYVRMYDAG